MVFICVLIVLAVLCVYYAVGVYYARKSRAQDDVRLAVYPDTPDHTREVGRK